MQIYTWVAKHLKLGNVGYYLNLKYVKHMLDDFCLIYLFIEL